MSYFHNPFLLGALAVTLLCTLIVSFRNARSKNSPPGPPTFPIIGNIHQLPLKRPYIKFTEWARKYGGLYSIKIGPQTIVMISDAKVLKDLYERRGAIYSSRPNSHIGGEIVCPNETHILFMPYGERSRSYRHAYNAFMGPRHGEQLSTIQAAEATKLLGKLVSAPEKYYEHMCCNATAVILECHYGIFPNDYEDPIVKETWRIQKEWVKIIALGATPPIDAFPFLKALPDILAPWRIRAKNIRKSYRKLYYGLLREVKARLAKERATGSFLEKLLQGTEKYGFDKEQLMHFSATLMEAGSDTTATAMISFVLGCLNNPEVLSKAQEEVDQVCGALRSPTLDDRDSMPYIQACVNEVLRWRPTLPFSVARELTQDDYYEGYFLPKGTILFQLTWAMSMDEDVYENPNSFDPSRFIRNRFGTKFEAEEDEKNGRKEQYAFGAGRKNCPGERFARNTLFVTISKLVWAFNITSPIDPKTGKPMVVDTDTQTAFTDGITSTPLKFPANFTIRSQTHQETVDKEILIAEKVISELKNGVSDII